jgi:acyl-CoA synthetase (AMP-forming)/AMP-acid ligase II
MICEIDKIRINAAIKTQLAAGGLKGALLKKAVDAKLHKWRTTGEVTHKLYDALVFRKVRQSPHQFLGVTDD